MTTTIAISAVWLAVLWAPCGRAEVVWKAVPKEILSLRAPLVEKDAPAEILFREVRMSVEHDDLVVSEYVRIKIFADRGRDYATVSIPYFDQDKIREASGRTIKPDGTIHELARDAIFSRTVAKSHGVNIKVTSFVLPDVGTGDIIEYYWSAKTELRPHYPIDVQTDIPAEHVHIVVGTKTSLLFAQLISFNLPTPKKVESSETSLEFENLPAIREEPLAPPDAMTHGWILVSLHALMEPSYSALQFEFLAEHLKVSSDIRRAAAAIAGKVSSPDDKLRTLYEYCHTRIQNTSHQQDSREDVLAGRKANRKASDTLKRGFGTGADIDLLFAALARAAGFDARWAAVPDGGEIIYDQQRMLDPYFFRAYDVAVRVDGKWQFFDPATPQLAFGMLRWQEENQQAMILDERTKSIEWVTTPFTSAALSGCNRVSTLRLSPDGTLEGDIRARYAGQLGFETRQKMAEESSEKWQKNYADAMRNRWRGSDVSELHIEKASDPSDPLIVSFHLRIPGYATRTGRRLFFRPALFEAGESPQLTAKTREQSVYYHYDWTEDDQYNIEFPSGFVPDNPDRPAAIAASGIGLRYEVQASIAGGSRLTYHRSLSFGKGGWMIVPVTHYEELKRVLDAVQQSDNHIFTLKQVSHEVTR